MAGKTRALRPTAHTLVITVHALSATDGDDHEPPVRHIFACVTLPLPIPTAIHNPRGTAVSDIVTNDERRDQPHDTAQKCYPDTKALRVGVSDFYCDRDR